eukprot:TRINITY_DN2075_c0_g4_i1.p1 TRINITY_DN2075_c0_g4~~TRINITY_DN2075_c0_g4_i1.p1  ORF type:complete len:625 (-),score=128.03 TRINITY_DN2075_c0_g4_i1:792-2666(-)
MLSRVGLKRGGSVVADSLPRIPDAVQLAFQDVVGNDKGVTLFLSKYQKETDLNPYWKEAGERIALAWKKKGDADGAEEFFKLLLTPEATPALEHEVTQDMTLPMSHYFIYTSHNTYLTGNQLTSDAGTGPIIQSLTLGVRVIELDIWPNDKKTDVIVKHGGTMTKPVGLEECVEAIRDHAFDATPYPVILTLEDHLPGALKARTAEVLQRVLGDLLWVPPVDVPMEQFMSPESLLNRVIISTQPPKVEGPPAAKGGLAGIAAGEGVEATSGSPAGSPPQRQGSSKSISSFFGKGRKQHSVDGAKGKVSSASEVPPSIQAVLTDGDASASAIEALEIAEADEAEAPKELTEAYRRMIAIAGGRMKGESVSTSLQDGAVVKRVSLSESQLTNEAKAHPDDLVRFTQRNILRIYPAGTRVDSSNYDPMLGWIHGAQMVALNMQGAGKPLRMQRAFFSGNGKSGYIRKPDYLMAPGKEPPEGEYSYWNPRSPAPVATTLKLTVLVGTGWRERFGEHHFDQFSLPDFFVEVKVYGVACDSKKETLETRKDQWNPSWDEKVLEFPLHFPELALLKLEVLEEDMGKSDFAGEAMLPIRFLKPGFRCVSLCDKNSTEYGGPRLLLHIEFSQP